MGAAARVRALAEHGGEVQAGLEGRASWEVGGRMTELGVWGRSEILRTWGVTGQD